MKGVNDRNETGRMGKGMWKNESRREIVEMIDTKLSIIGNWEKKNETKSGGG